VGRPLVNLVQAKLAIKQEDTKIDLARQMIKHVVEELKVKVSWVCFDALYRRVQSLLAD
jgi:hypothetical protein